MVSFHLGQQWSVTDRRAVASARVDWLPSDGVPGNFRTLPSFADRFDRAVVFGFLDGIDNTSLHASVCEKRNAMLPIAALLERFRNCYTVFFTELLSCHS